MRLGRPQGHLDIPKRRKISASSWDLNPDHPASSLDIWTAPFQLLSIYNSNLKQGTKKTCPSQVANDLFIRNWKPKKTFIWPTHWYFTIYKNTTKILPQQKFHFFKACCNIAYQTLNWYTYIYICVSVLPHEEWVPTLLLSSAGKMMVCNRFHLEMLPASSENEIGEVGWGGGTDRHTKTAWQQHNTNCCIFLRNKGSAGTIQP